MVLAVSRDFFFVALLVVFFGVEQINLDLHDFLLKSSPHKLFQCFLTCHLRTIKWVQLFCPHFFLLSRWPFKTWFTVLPELTVLFVKEEDFVFSFCWYYTVGMARAAGMGAAVRPWAALQLVALVRFFTHPVQQEMYNKLKILCCSFWEVFIHSDHGNSFGTAVQQSFTLYSVT